MISNSTFGSKLTNTNCTNLTNMISPAQSDLQSDCNEYKDFQSARSTFINYSQICPASEIKKR